MAMNTRVMGMNGIVKSGGEKKQWRLLREKEHASEGLGSPLFLNPEQAIIEQSSNLISNVDNLDGEPRFQS